MSTQMMTIAKALYILKIPPELWKYNKEQRKEILKKYYHSILLTSHPDKIDGSTVDIDLITTAHSYLKDNMEDKELVIAVPNMDPVTYFDRISDVKMKKIGRSRALNKLIK